MRRNVEEDSRSKRQKRHIQQGTEAHGHHPTPKQVANGAIGKVQRQEVTMDPCGQIHYTAIVAIEIQH